MKHDIAVLKDRLRIPDVWLNFGYQGRPARICRSPFREDRKPSFSVYDDGRKWMDHATGERGDVIDFIGRALGLGKDEAMRRFLAMCGEPLQVERQAPRAHVFKGLKLPAQLSQGAPDEWRAVARSRGIHPYPINYAATGLKTLWFGQVCGEPSWILTDSARKVAEARRMDGKPYPAIGDLMERKAHTIAGSCKAWPVGIAVLKDNPGWKGCLMLVEGGPDYLAALHFVFHFQRIDVLPVAMLGRNASAVIPADALKLFRGRRVRVYPHADADGGGVASAERWGLQLCEVGCEVDACHMEGLTRSDGQPVKDLNDAALIPTERLPELAELLPR